VIYRFENFSVDEATRQLLAGAHERPLSPKAFELLTLLLANHPRALSKLELQERLWPATFVQETNIAGLVAEIRRALGDSATDSRFVRTVHRFGYRFVADVSTDRGLPAPSRPAATLALIVDRRQLLLADGANVVGRSPDATIHIDSPGLSRLHARVQVSEGIAMIEDLDSKNGTYVNGTRIARATRLSDGDELRLGALVLTFRSATPGSPTETVAAPPAQT
jgi:DNA-binding winged helix-turn-helix (wHTH) protein